VTVAAWAGLHPKKQRRPGHGSRGPRPIVRGTVIRVQVQRVPAKTRPPKVLWLWWAGCGELNLDPAWPEDDASLDRVQESNRVLAAVSRRGGLVAVDPAEARFRRSR
jgi:hypothetical protein